MYEGQKEIPYWPYCETCHEPFDFSPDEPFATCNCGTTEWGYPRPYAWVPNPHLDSMDQVSKVIHDWANRTFPGRHPKSSLSKLVMEEIPEMLIDAKGRGGVPSPGEVADGFILFLDCARIWKINVGQAIAEKMAINLRRTWQLEPETGFYHHQNVQPVVDFSDAERVRKDLHDRGEA